MLEIVHGAGCVRRTTAELRVPDGMHDLEELSRAVDLLAQHTGSRVVLLDLARVIAEGGTEEKKRGTRG